MEMISILICGLLGVYLAYAGGFTLLFSVAALVPERRRSRRAIVHLRKILVLIPAYKEDAVIVDSARAALNQNYPSDRYKVCVIADQLQPATLDRLRELPISVVEVQFEQSTKVKALNAALRALPEDHDVALILDADNVMERSFLRHLNQRFEAGDRAVQGQRVAKNGHTHTAVLDGLSEAVNNRIYCAGHNRLGLSARLAGSGMAFEYNLFREVMAENQAVGGFDKEMEVQLTSRGVFLRYAPEAQVFDEKVSRGDHFYRQRRRWLSAQYANLRRFWPLAVRQLGRGNVDCFHRVAQMALPPRLLLPVFLAVLTAGAWMTGWFPIFWTTVFAANVIGMSLAIPRSFWGNGGWKALLQLPGIAWQTLRAVAHLSGANRTFIHTPHGTTNE